MWINSHHRTYEIGFFKTVFIFTHTSIVPFYDCKGKRYILLLLLINWNNEIFDVCFKLYVYVAANSILYLTFVMTLNIFCSFFSYAIGKLVLNLYKAQTCQRFILLFLRNRSQKMHIFSAERSSPGC